MFFCISVSVVKEGEDENCGYYNHIPEWGCFSSGYAHIIDYYNSTYYDANQAQTLNIVDASNSTFYFTVELYENDFRENYAETYKHKSTLDITVGDTEGSFKHKREEGDELDEDYTSQMIVKVKCDDNCSCEMDKVAAE